MKRIISFLLLAVFAVSLLATGALAADASVSGSASGSTATVTVSATGVSSFSSCFVRVNYDGSVLNLKDVKSGSALGGMDVSKVTSASQVEGQTSMYAWNTGSDSDGDYALIAYANANSIASNSVIFTLSFDVLDASAVSGTEVVAYVTMSDANGGDVLKEAKATGDIVSASAVMLGDVNGDGQVNARDALLAARYAAGISVSGFNAEAANVNGDAGINARDALLIARFAAGIITEF